MATVLVVDQDPARLIALSMTLQSLGHFVLEATDQHRASLEVERHVEPIDLVIADSESFAGVFDRLPKSGTRTIPVVVLSQPSEAADRAGLGHDIRNIVDGDLASTDALVDMISGLPGSGVRNKRHSTAAAGMVESASRA